MLGKSPAKTVLTSALVLLPIGAAVAWFRADTKASNPSGLPEELTVESLKAQAKDPARIGETMRSAFEREDLTDEQRREAMQNMRRVWRESLRERVDEYFNATAAEAEVVLDRHLDEFVERMQDMRDARERMEATRKNGEESAPTQRERWRGMAQRTQQERKERSESRSADETARAMLYFNNLQARAAQRGISFPRPGPGGRGPGRGPGGQRPGP